MKHCPTCNATFDDDTLTHCQRDGTLLSEAVAQAPQDLGGKATWSASQDQIPELQKYITSTKPAPQPRRTWSWIVAAVAILILLLIVLLSAILLARRG